MRKLFLTAIVMLFCMTAAAVANDEEFSEVEYYRKLAEKQLAEAQAKVEVEVPVPAEPAPEPEPVAPIVYVEPVVEAAPPPPPAPEVCEAEEVPPAPVVVYLPPPLPELEEPVYQYRECYECEEDNGPKNALVVVPQYYNSRVKEGARFDVGGIALKSAKGHANGASVTLLYNRRFSDMFSVAVMYEHAFMNVKSGGAIPEAAYNAGGRVYEDSRWNSNVVGIQPEINFGKWGRLQPSLVFGFDRASGTETTSLPNGTVSRRNMDGDGTNVISLMAWYEKDFDLADGFKLTPYAGWRSLHVTVRPSDEKLWVHLASGGMKASYQKGAVGFTVRGGINHRTTSDDLPAYGNRAVAPGLIHFSHRANQDRTIGTFGAGINFAIKKRLMVGVNYDGFVGKNTSAHTGTISFALPF